MEDSLQRVLRKIMIPILAIPIGCGGDQPLKGTDMKQVPVSVAS